MKWFANILLNAFLLAFLLISCKKDSPPENPFLNLVSQYPINISGLSGLSPYMNGEFLAVDDKICKVHIISNTGDVIRTLNYTGDDLEGITYIPNDSTIYVVEEKKKEIVKLDTNGNEIFRFSVILNNSDEKHGLEGISFNPANEHLYVVSEQSPSLLMEMTLSGEVIETHELTFAEDYSSVYFDPLDSSLWILSDKSKIVAKCDLTGNPVKQYNTGSEKFEGLIVDSKNARIYITNDQINTLYVFSY